MLLATVQGYSGDVSFIAKSDTGDIQIVGFFDLRERESFIQITKADSEGDIIHIQIFNVNDLCNENNFFDAYTPNDTHVYNLRDILTNDGNPSGVVLPSDAYGIVVATLMDRSFGEGLIGNLRILDSSGYEYRTNLLGTKNSINQDSADKGIFTFNFNTVSGVTLSDVVGILLGNVQSLEVIAADVSEIWASFDIDILNDSEVVFSCRDVAFACINEEHPRLEELLEEAEVSVASFDYGINNAIPHSRGGELLCPGNTISDGIVRLEATGSGNKSGGVFFVFVGLNNGNGRGSLDSIWNQSSITPFPGGGGGGG